MRNPDHPQLLGRATFPSQWPWESEDEYRLRAATLHVGDGAASEAGGRALRFVLHVLQSDVRFEMPDANDLVLTAEVGLLLHREARADVELARGRALNNAEKRLLHDVASPEWKKRQERHVADDIADRLTNDAMLRDAANAQRAQHERGQVVMATGFEYLTGAV